METYGSTSPLMDGRHSEDGHTSERHKNVQESALAAANIVHFVMTEAAFIYLFVALAGYEPSSVEAKYAKSIALALTIVQQLILACVVLAASGYVYMFHGIFRQQ